MTSKVVVLYMYFSLCYLFSIFVTFLFSMLVYHLDLRKPEKKIHVIHGSDTNTLSSPPHRCHLLAPAKT